ncbi:hypothetical protein RJ639_021812 [Escallonia herrerae]|uniref:Bet v I/Major latex protein domain-containing protein n=1 Tax=Escallonia herrerae TaxID=1293975 RepID=A0AA88V3D3_9ASTE|nr:hypothetical protein RJ639_021812 [Escallonia herrerae]
MHGKLSSEVTINVPASEAWDLYGTLKLADVVIPEFFSKIDVLKGDGEVGTVLKLFFNPGALFYAFEETIVTIDNKKMIKETDASKGGYLDMGFNLYRIRYDVIPKTRNSCITRVTVEYDLKEGWIYNTSHVSLLPFMGFLRAGSAYLLANTKSKTSD